MDCKIYTLSILTFIVLKISHTTSEPSDAAESAIDDQSRMDEGNLGAIYAALPATNVYDKRGSLMRFGKRGSLMRFGKRGSLLRFGKRSSLMRFGKRYGYDSDEEDNFMPAEYYPEYPEGENYGANKRGSLMRFGKKSSIMRFGRSVGARTEKAKAHTPWRFGREEEEEEWL